MRKFLMVAAIGALAVLMAAPAMALDFKFSGEYRFRFYDGVNIGFDNTQSSNPKGAQVRLRPRFDVSDDNGNIQGVWRLEVGDVEFGNGGGAAGNTFGTVKGGGVTSYNILGNSGSAGTGNRVGNGAGGMLGADGVAVETKWAYVDFAAPFGVPLRIRAGIQPWYLPKGIVIDDDISGVRAYGNAGMLAYEAAWYRASGGASTNVVPAGAAGQNTTSNLLDNNYDFYLGRIDLKLAPVFNPGLYVIYGSNKSGAPLTTGASLPPLFDRNADNWYVGLTTTGKAGIFSYDFDFVYGSAEGGPNGSLINLVNGERIKTRGWAADVHGAIPVGPVTINLAAAYATGDKNDGGDSEAFPAIAPSWNGAGGGFEMIGSGGPFDAVEFTQDYMTNLWMIGGWLEYRPVKALWTKLAIGYAGFAHKNGNCAVVTSSSPTSPCFGPSYFGKPKGTGNALVGKSGIGTEISLRADYDLWTNFKIQGQLGWLFPPAGSDVAAEYVLQFLYNF